MCDTQAPLLLHPPTILVPEQRSWITAIGLTVEAATRAYDELNASLWTVSEPRFRAATVSDVPAAAALSCAWALVDAHNRLRLLLENPPTGADPARLPRVRGFLERAGAIRDLRHSHQHLDERIAGLAAAQIPAWGSLAWIASSPAHDFLIAGVIGAAVSETTTLPMVNPLGQMISPPIDLVELHAYRSPRNDATNIEPASVQLSSAQASLLDAKAELEAVLGPQFTGHPRGPGAILATVEVHPEQPDT